jgi:hypothetical protein
MSAFQYFRSNLTKVGDIELKYKSQAVDSPPIRFPTENVIDSQTTHNFLSLFSHFSVLWQV